MGVRTVPKTAENLRGKGQGLAWTIGNAGGFSRGEKALKRSVKKRPTMFASGAFVADVWVIMSPQHGHADDFAKPLRGRTNGFTRPRQVGRVHDYGAAAGQTEGFMRSHRVTSILETGKAARTMQAIYKTWVKESSTLDQPV